MTDPARAEPLVLALESSCDETACAILRGRRVLANVVASQIATHARFGGIVPELASRAHLDAVVPVTTAALHDAGGLSLDDLDAVAVTHGPGLIGALLVGVQAAKGLALALGKPLYGVHHMEGHLYSTALCDERGEGPEFGPHLALLVSGGHTELVVVEGLGKYRRLGGTRDDAVGEAYDKVGKILGVGYPGGPVIDRLAREGNPEAIHFPRAMLQHDNFEFSFAGLKTAVAVHIDREGQPDSLQALQDICASFQAAVVEILATKTLRARAELGFDRVCVVGGAAANSGLRTALEDAAAREGFEFVPAALRYCGDNAAMIGAAAAARISAGVPPTIELFANRSLEQVLAEPAA